MKSTVSRIASSALWVAWQTVRLPLLAVLVTLEPVVSVVLGGLALLGLLVGAFLEFSGAAPRFPFLGMVAFSVGCVVLLAIYHAAIAWLSR